MSTGLSSGVEGILNQAVENSTVPGAIFALTNPDGEIQEVTAGTLGIDNDDPVTTSTMFRLMSMTKALTSVGALQLIEQGELGLEQEVASVRPEFAEIKVLDGFDGDRPRLREPKRQATIKHLLTHTAGHGYAFGNAELLRYHEATGVPNELSGLRASLGKPLIADPGTVWNYGINTDWLGQVIEAVSGQDLAAYLEEHVFRPLGMSDTTFAPTDEQSSRMMQLHARTPDGGLALMEWPVPEPEFWPGGHGASGTAGDYARFMTALMRGGELDGARILSPETVDLMFTDQLGGIPVPTEIKSAMPELSNDVISPPFSQGFGLGLHVFTEDLPGMRRAGSGDWSGLCNCYYWIDRTSGVAGAFLTQVLPYFDARILETALGIEQAVYAELLSPA